MAEMFAQYQAEYKSLRALDRVHPVFVLDDSWITPPARPWWERWNSYGDVSCHDNYPLDFRVDTLARSNGQGVPATVGLAVKSVNESKPVWLVVQAWEDGPWQMPSARELRGQVYTGIVHGATGIHYFAMDSYVTRAGSIIGMGPRELLNNSYPGHHFPSTDWFIASPSLLDMAAAAWEAAAKINGELKTLMPAIFSPTSSKPYAVAFQGMNVSTTPIRSLRKTSPDGQDILLVVNVDQGRSIATFTVTGLRAGASVEVLFEDRAVQVVAGGSFSDGFEGLGAHVYRLPLIKTDDPSPARWKTDDSRGTRGVMGWTVFNTCGDHLCPNQTAQVQHIVNHSDVIRAITPFVFGSGNRTRANYSWLNDTNEVCGGSFNFGMVGNSGKTGPPSRPGCSDNSGRCFCAPSPDTLVTEWVNPLRAAGVAVSPIIQGAPAVYPVDSDPFFDDAVAAGLKFGLAGYSLDVEYGNTNWTAYAIFVRLFESRLAAHGMQLSVASGANWDSSTAGGIANFSQWNTSGTTAALLGLSAADVMTMGTYYGTRMPAPLPAECDWCLKAEVNAWQEVVSVAHLVIGFGALYPAWDAHGLLSLNDSLAVCRDAGVQRVALFMISFHGWNQPDGKPPPGSPSTIPTPWPPDSWWGPLRGFVRNVAEPQNHRTEHEPAATLQAVGARKLPAKHDEIPGQADDSDGATAAAKMHGGEAVWIHGAMVNAPPQLSEICATGYGFSMSCADPNQTMNSDRDVCSVRRSNARTRIRAPSSKLRVSTGQPASYSRPRPSKMGRRVSLPRTRCTYR